MYLIHSWSTSIGKSDTPADGAGDANRGDRRNGPGVKARPRPRPFPWIDDALGRSSTTPSCMLEGGGLGAGAELSHWTSLGSGMGQGGQGGMG